MTLKILEEAKNAMECTQWLHHCQAECCKTLKFNITNSNTLKKIQPRTTLRLRLPEELSDDMKRYFRIHGVRVQGDDVLVISLKNYQLSGTELFVYARCRRLSKNNLCLDHPDAKPEFCKELTLETARDPKFCLTNNCLYKYKMEAER